MRSYFPISLHQEQEFDGSEALLFVIHPHGIIGFSAWLSFVRTSSGRCGSQEELLRFGLS